MTETQPDALHWPSLGLAGIAGRLGVDEVDFVSSTRMIPSWLLN